MDYLELARKAYLKGVKIVNSCDCANHMDTARKYLENFWLNVLMPTRGKGDYVSVNSYYQGLRNIYDHRYELLGICDNPLRDLEDDINSKMVQDFLERVDEPGPWPEEYDKIHTVGGLSNDKDGSFMEFQKKISKKKK